MSDSGQATSIPVPAVENPEWLELICALEASIGLSFSSELLWRNPDPLIILISGPSSGILHLPKIPLMREIYVQLQESVRGCDIFLLQPTCLPVNVNLMELKVMIDACRRDSTKNITVVTPYFGYARDERKTQGRESIAAKLVANLITEAGANRLLACDIHSRQSLGYFDIAVDHVYCEKIHYDDLVVVFPDVGRVARAHTFAKKLSDAPLAIVGKRRHGHNLAEVMNLIHFFDVSYALDVYLMPHPPPSPPPPPPPPRPPTFEMDLHQKVIVEPIVPAATALKPSSRTRKSATSANIYVF
ncbi:hypothetical protein UlMin_038356 [Ulmus minor]